MKHEPAQPRTTAFRILPIREYPGGAHIIYRPAGRRRFVSFDAVRYPDRAAAQNVIEKELERGR